MNLSYSFIIRLGLSGTNNLFMTWSKLTRVSAIEEFSVVLCCVAIGKNIIWPRTFGLRCTRYYYRLCDIFSWNCLHGTLLLFHIHMSRYSCWCTTFSTWWSTTTTQKKGKHFWTIACWIAWHNLIGTVVWYFFAPVWQRLSFITCIIRIGRTKWQR